MRKRILNRIMILNILKSGVITADFIIGILAGEGLPSYKNLRKMAYYRALPSREYMDRNRLRKNFYSLMYKLEKEGLVQRKKDNNKSVYWIIKEKLINKPRRNLFPSGLRYRKEKDESLTLVIFDIPEKFKSKRTWLRKMLVLLEYKMLQKSVWMGENKLPKDFIEDVEAVDIFKYVHIFKVSKFGTINK